MELSKRDKKIARQLIDLGVQREFAKGLLRAKEILQQWDPSVEDHKPSYAALYGHVTAFDKHIARRYDRVTGGYYFFKIVELLQDKVITIDETAGFSDDVRNRLVFIIKELN